MALSTLEYEDDRQDLRLPAAVGGVNVVVFALASLLGLIDVVGLTLLVGVCLLPIAYLQWVWGRPRVAGLLAAGTLPFWLLLFAMVT